MKKLLTIATLLISAICYGQVKQEIFFSPLLDKYVLITNDGSIYNSSVFGSKEYVESQKQIELNKALAREKPIAIITAKCKP
jgi:hypothetical protein